jgi:hypothetical protein
MNDRQLERKISRDAGKVKKDVSTLVGDSAVQLGRFGDDVSQATDKVKEDVASWVEDGASRMSEGFEKLKGDAIEAAVGVATTVKKNVGDGLSQYNAKAMEIANEVSSDINKKVARYPWVAISIGVGVGLLLGGLLNHGRKLLN